MSKHKLLMWTSQLLFVHLSYVLLWQSVAPNRFQCSPNHCRCSPNHLPHLSPSCRTYDVLSNWLSVLTRATLYRSCICRWHLRQNTAFGRNVRWVTAWLCFAQYAQRIFVSKKGFIYLLTLTCVYCHIYLRFSGWAKRELAVVMDYGVPRANAVSKMRFIRFLPKGQGDNLVSTYIYFPKKIPLSW